MKDGDEVLQLPYPLMQLLDYLPLLANMRFKPKEAPEDDPEEYEHRDNQHHERFLAVPAARSVIEAGNSLPDCTQLPSRGDGPVSGPMAATAAVEACREFFQLTSSPVIGAVGHEAREAPAAC